MISSSYNLNFSNNKKGGGTDKIINELFIEGLSPPIFKSIVKDLGTTDVRSTIMQLDDIYRDLENYLKWSKRAGDMNRFKEKKPEIKSQEKSVISKFIPCTSLKCNSTLHTADKCYFLHPELRPDAKKVPSSKKAQVAVTADNSSLELTSGLCRRIEGYCRFHDSPVGCGKQRGSSK